MSDVGLATAPGLAIRGPARLKKLRTPGTRFDLVRLKKRLVRSAEPYARHRVSSNGAQISGGQWLRPVGGLSLNLRIGSYSSRSDSIRVQRYLPDPDWLPVPNLVEIRRAAISTQGD